MVNKIRHHKAVLAKGYRRWIFEERKRKNIGLVSVLDPGQHAAEHCAQRTIAAKQSEFIFCCRPAG
jgi:hypothetical protein